MQMRQRETLLHCRFPRDDTPVVRGLEVAALPGKNNAGADAGMTRCPAFNLTFVGIDIWSLA